jgi:hypothetical protein
MHEDYGMIGANFIGVRSLKASRCHFACNDDCLGSSFDPDK